MHICDKDVKTYNDYFINFINHYKDKNYVIKKFFVDAPFIIVEHYFYYDILRQLFEHKDPYFQIKNNYMDNNTNIIRDIINKYVEFCERVNNMDINRKKIYMDYFIEESLFGNTTDLSQAIIHMKLKENPKILIDNRKEVFSYLNHKKLNRIDMIIDNTGVELICDIILALSLIDAGLVDDIYFHTKILPIFVSDTIISEYGNDSELVNSKIKSINLDVYNKIVSLEKENRIKWCPNYFWNTPVPFNQIGKTLKRIFSSSDLLIIKGDLNYRRLIEDREWSHQTPILSIVNYLESPCLIIRTLKSNLIVDLPKEEEDKAENIDQDWKTSGKYGIIQFLKFN